MNHTQARKVLNHLLRQRKELRRAAQFPPARERYRQEIAALEHVIARCAEEEK